jgi:Flp pilus assembly pilin Flp
LTTGGRFCTADWLPAGRSKNRLFQEKAFWRGRFYTIKYIYLFRAGLTVHKIPDENCCASTNRRASLAAGAKKFLISQDALEVVEYAIILGIITIGVLIALKRLGEWVADQYQAAVEDTSGS